MLYSLLIYCIILVIMYCMWLYYAITYYRYDARRLASRAATKYTSTLLKPPGPSWTYDNVRTTKDNIIFDIIWYNKDGVHIDTHKNISLTFDKNMGCEFYDTTCVGI